MEEIGLAEQTPGTEVADLTEQLNSGLKSRLPADFAFVDRVVALVEQDVLPIGMVTGTFQWARKKKPYPFPYFERAMRLRAAQIGVEI